jgi:alanine-glyoxylate transaminase/serine-glyoxylate transaminase/serine-pyruvate transaminase
MTGATFTGQPPHPTLLMPGPIEVDDAVANSMSHYAESHFSLAFCNTFGEALTMLRKLFQTTNPASQPFVIGGSGTLGWDLVAANLVEPGEDVLVLHTGYFADTFAKCLAVYGAKPKQLKAPIGETPQLDEIERALKEKKYKALTVTHVDTSTGVLTPLKPLCDLLRRVSPDTLFLVDGVCSVACEEIKFDDWGIDALLTGSQKAIGCPPGLSITMVSERGIEVSKFRKSPPGSYYACLENWLPVMQKYEEKKPSYFATPPTQIVHALHTALKQILSRPLNERFEQHKKISAKVKAVVAELGLKQLPSKPDNQATGMTTMYLPEGLIPTDILPNLLEKGVVFAAGIHKDIATKYIRCGHMGVSVMDEDRGDIDRAIQALKDGLAECQESKRTERFEYKN